MRFSSCVGGNRNYSQFYYELRGLFLLIVSSGSLLALSNFFTSTCQSLLKGALTGSSANLPCTFSVQPSCPVKSNHLGRPGLAAPSPQFRENAGGHLGPPPWTLPHWRESYRSPPVSSLSSIMVFLSLGCFFF